MRRAAKIDDNQMQVVSALRKIGANVCSLAAIGGGVPDLLVYFRHRLMLLEIKDGSKFPSQRTLTAHQERFHKLFPVAVVTTVDDAIAAVSKNE